MQGREEDESDDEARFPFHENDLIYRHLVTDVREESNAVVICIMDTSGSMDTMKKYLARSFFFLLYQFVRSKYRNVEIVFIAHHTEAKEVTEEEFFHKGESGGTFISSGYQRRSRLSPSATIRRCGMSMRSTAPTATTSTPTTLPPCAAAKELCEVCNLFGYGEIKPLGSRYYESSMLNIFRRLEATNFQTVLIERKEDVWPSFKALLAKDRAARLRDAPEAHERRTTSKIWRSGTSGFARIATEFGLDCYPQEFEICDHNQMLGYMAYSGMPSHYPHWSYGKTFEKLKTLYDYGVSGLPYEMVINSNPALAYLMRDNSLALQILTIAHVYGHNDFFKNNFTFATTRAEYTSIPSRPTRPGYDATSRIRASALDRVESILDAAHALSLQCRRNLAVRKPSEEEARQAALEAATPPPDPFQRIHRPPDYVEPDLRKVPLVPDEDVLALHPRSQPVPSEWERDLLTIVHEEAQYFIPQIETKIMNEGWAPTGTSEFSIVSNCRKSSTSSSSCATIRWSVPTLGDSIRTTSGCACGKTSDAATTRRRPACVTPSWPTPPKMDCK